MMNPRHKSKDGLAYEDARLSGCEGKAGYLTWGAANKVLCLMRKSHRVRGSVTIYRCRTCGMFHHGGENRFKHA